MKDTPLKKSIFLGKKENVKRKGKRGRVSSKVGKMKCTVSFKYVLVIAVITLQLTQKNTLSNFRGVASPSKDKMPDTEKGDFFWTNKET